MTGPSPAPPLLAVAHRAGNRIDLLREALDAGVDLVEADVHRFRRTLEVRHWKTLGRRLLWERWELALRREIAPIGLLDVLSELGGDARLMLDLKGVHPALASEVAAMLRRAAPDVPIAVCTRHWWMVEAFARDPHIRVILSAGSRLGVLRLQDRLRDRPAGRDGPAVFGVSVHRRLLTPPVVTQLRRRAGHVLTWPVDTAAELAEARALGVSGVTSKSLPLLREIVTAR